MSGPEAFQLLALPFALGLVGFVEPCSIGSTLIFLKVMEGRSASVKVLQVAAFALTRGAFIGLLGALTVVAGAAFFGYQKAAWIVLGAAYCLLGALYLVGRAGPLMKTLGPRLTALAGLRGPAALGVIFGLNVPACAAPLLVALLGGAAASGASGATMLKGFVSLALFGLALSLPLVVAVLVPRVRDTLDWVAGLSRRAPVWTGVMFVLLGLWSIRFGLVVPAPA